MATLPPLLCADPATHGPHPSTVTVRGKRIDVWCKGYTPIVPSGFAVVFAGTDADGTGPTSYGAKEGDLAAAHEHDRQLQRADSVVAYGDAVARYPRFVEGL